MYQRPENSQISEPPGGDMLQIISEMMPFEVLLACFAILFAFQNQLEFCYISSVSL